MSDDCKAEYAVTDITTKCVNLDLSSGTFKMRKGWKSFRGMVHVLKKINKRYNKLKIVGDFTVRLPLREK